MSTDDVEIVPTSLTPRERRHFFQPLWRQALSVLMIVALVFTTTPTEVRAQGATASFFYYVTDHLGSSSILLDRDGARIQHYENSAYGSQRFSETSLNVTHRYTGQVFDEDTGLYYYNARYYDPELGRFTQPDTIVPSPGDPQTLNRYSYVNNNPLKYVDPSGHVAAAVIIAAVVIGAAIGAASAAAQGANGQGIALAALVGGLGALFGGVGAFAGGVVGGAITGTAAGATWGSLAGAVAGGAVGGAVGASITGGDIGTGALTGAIAGAIGFGVGQLGFQNPTGWEYWANAGLSSAGGAAGGAAGAAIQGGDAGLGAAYGAGGGFAGYWLTQGIMALEYEKVGPLRVSRRLPSEMKADIRDGVGYLKGIRSILDDPRAEGVNVKPGKDGPEAVKRSFLVYPKHRLGIGPTVAEAFRLNPQDPIPAGPPGKIWAGIIAHELGHILHPNYTDSYSWSPSVNNVIQFENPVRAQLGIPLRTSYHGKPFLIE